MEFENLAKQYLTHLMKQECWDGMDVKGRAIEVSLNFQVSCHTVSSQLSCNAVRLCIELELMLLPFARALVYQWRYRTIL